MAVTSVTWSLVPVTLPPGRARLATSPEPTMSAAAATTMGMVVVPAFAAWAAGTPWVTRNGSRVWDARAAATPSPM